MTKEPTDEQPRGDGATVGANFQFDFEPTLGTLERTGKYPENSGERATHMGHSRGGGTVDGNGAGSQLRTKVPNDPDASPETVEGRSVKNLLTVLPSIKEAVSLSDSSLCFLNL